MTLQEAIESGRPFKRKEWNYWLQLNTAGYLVCDGTYSKVEFKVEDILADDWEVKNEVDIGIAKGRIYIKLNDKRLWITKNKTETQILIFYLFNYLSSVIGLKED